MTISDDAASTQYDLLSVLTHEAGHFLGMAHAIDNPEATMNPTYQPMTIGFRSLEPDDGLGICAMYPPDDEPPAEDCNPIPRHGYSPNCKEGQVEGTCSTIPSGRRPTRPRPSLPWRWRWLPCGGAVAHSPKRRPALARMPLRESPVSKSTITDLDARYECRSEAVPARDR